MDSPVSAISYLERAKELRLSEDRASQIYAALELRCGVEARLQEHAAATTSVSKRQATRYEIAKIGKAIDLAFGLGDSLLIVNLRMEDGRECNFVYAPVSDRLKEIAMRCGDYLHAMRLEKVSAPNFWNELSAMLEEGCNLLEVACSSEVLCPSLQDGLHFSLPLDDPRIPIVQDYQAGDRGSFSTVKFTPTGRMTFYPPNAA